MAVVKLFYDWDWPGAEAEFRRAIELNPNYPTGHHGYAVLLLTVYGRWDAAIAEADRPLELDPLSIPITNIVALILTYSPHYDEAIARAKKLAELNPKMPEAYHYMSKAYEAKGSSREAAESSLNEHSLEGATAQDLTRLKEAYARGGIDTYRRTEAQITIENAQRQVPQTVLGRLALASSYAQIGNSSGALDILEQICSERSGMAVWTKIDYSGFPTTRDNPRFQALIRRISLPQ